MGQKVPLTPDLLRWILSAEWSRSALAAATFGPAQSMLDQWETDPNPHGCRRLIDVMDKLFDRLDGTETFDRVRFLSLRSDLKSLSLRDV